MNCAGEAPRPFFPVPPRADGALRRIAMRKPRPALILALGNNAPGCRGAASRAARLLRAEFLESVDVVETEETGPPLLGYLEPYGMALVLSAAATGKYPPGTILRLGREELRRGAPSRHSAGLPQLMELAERSRTAFPNELIAVCMETGDTAAAGETLTAEAGQALPAMVAAAREILTAWGCRA